MRFAGTEAEAVSGLVSSRALVATALRCGEGEILERLGRARERPDLLVEADPDWEERDPERLGEVLPLVRFYQGDGGPYGTAFVFAARSRRFGLNLSFHRMMHLGGNRFAVRVVRRHLHAILEEGEGRAQAAAFAGVHPAVLLAAAVSAEPELDELAMAAGLLGEALGVSQVADGLLVPSHAEVVLVGRFTGELAEEGPFVDLTGTWDGVRRQPVFQVDRFLVRPSPVCHVVVPAGPEHQLLMGLPREARLAAAARAAAPNVVDVALTPGGCGWLHAVVSLREPAPGQAVNVGLAVLAAHTSLKRVVLVDADIPVRDPMAVEWALATRFQPDRDLHVIGPARGSSLDPSRGEGSTTAKWILDATIPPGRDVSAFRRVAPFDFGGSP